MKKVLIIVGIVLALGFIGTACEDNGVDDYNEPQQRQEEYHHEEENIEVPEEIEEDFIFVEEPIATNDGYWDHIEGIIQNNSGEDYEYIQISFTLYDEDGNVVGTAWANTSGLKDGQTWKFDALITEDNVVRFELDEINAW